VIQQPFAKINLKTDVARARKLIGLDPLTPVWTAIGTADFGIVGFTANLGLGSGQDRIGQLVGGAGVNHVYYDSNAGGPNHLFRNAVEGENWNFIDVTHESGLDQNNRRFTLAASWEDVDNDGDQDLYVVNDFGRNCLYRNDIRPEGTRRFVDIAAEANGEDQASGMSVSWGDYDRDGLMDLYIGNMWSAAGQRVTSQTRFKPEIATESRRAYQRFTIGSTLLKNLGDDGFQDVSEASGAMMGRWAWASPFIDLNNDGWEDLFVANGYITGDPDSGDL